MAPSLHDGIERAGSPVKLLWKPNAKPWTPEVVQPEYAGWREEQNAWHAGVTISDLSHHMFDTFIDGPDATRLLTAVSANNYENFAIGQAKQFVPVNSGGNIVTDGILLRTAENTYVLSGIPAAQHWVQYFGVTGGFHVSFTTDPSTAFRNGADPTLFRYQIQGPKASELVERAFGGPPPPARLPVPPTRLPIPPTLAPFTAAKFFHSIPVTLDGMDFRALRHGMAGQPGFEFIGPWQHSQPVKDALMKAGEPLGLLHVGSLAYASASVESGWIPSPIPAVYSDPELAEYRKWLPLFGIEGQRPLHGSYYSENIEDYYCSPFELGYGRSVAFNHDFIGREALEKARDTVPRTKVTLVFHPADVSEILGTEFFLSYARSRVEVGGELVGLTYQTASLDPVSTVLSLTLIDKRFATPGTEVTVVWGDHPGPGGPADAHQSFPRIRATVQPAPFDEHARTK
jgi:glycine cleavage system aminomethyltransferase T